MISVLTINDEFIFYDFQYKKPQLLNEMEVAILKVLQDVETETDVDDFLQELLGKKQNK